MTLFRNLRVYQLDAPLPHGLEWRLSEGVFHPCQNMQAESIGWEPVADDCRLARPIGPDAELLRCRVQHRVLPNAAINEKLSELADQIEAAEGAPPKGARRRELADQIRMELLPTAPLQSVRHWLIVDRAHHRILIDSATASRCEAILSLLRSCLGNLGVRPLAFARPIDGSLTTWLRSGDPPDGFELGQWADMEHPQDTPNKVRFRCQPLDEDEVTATLDRGLRVTALELIHDADSHPLRVVVNDDGAFRRARFPDVDDPGDYDSEDARLDADMVTTLGLLRRLFARLFPALGGVVAE